MTEDSHANMDRDDILVEVAAPEVNLGEDAYPLVSRNKALRKFKSRFAEVFKKLVQALQKDPKGALYDERLLPSIVEWIICLSASRLRSFRHTCTFAAVELINGLILVAREEHDLLDKAQRLLQSETKKGKTAAAKAKAKQLQEDVELYENHVERLQELIQDCFSGVFVHRYRDIDVTIRTMTMDALGKWLVSYPELFLQDSFLKYPGWCLSDKAVSVRKAALECVLNMVEDGDEDKINKMQAMLLRFKKRFLEMTQDVDAKVAARAVDLITTLLKHTSFLGENDGDEIPSYIWDLEPVMRKAAVAFTLEDTFVLDEEEDERSEEQKNESDLVQLLNLYQNDCPHVQTEGLDAADMEEGAKEGIACLVDGFYEHLPVLQDYDVIHNHLLLTEKSSRKQRSKTVPDEQRQVKQLHE